MYGLRFKILGLGYGLHALWVRQGLYKLYSVQVQTFVGFDRGSAFASYNLYLSGPEGFGFQGLGFQVEAS